jgi:hypothetical protein
MSGAIAFTIKTHVKKRKLAETIEGHAFHKTRGDDAVGIDISAGNKYAAARDVGDFFQ